jgi:hypothetical protein
MMKIKYLSRLADLVVDIDENKYITDADVVSITDRGIRLIRHMKLLGLDIGALQETFTSMQLMCGNHVVLVELLDMAHDEIARLLGRDAWRVYGWDDGGLFFQPDETNNKVAA